MQNHFRFVLPIFLRATLCFLFPAIKSFILTFRILFRTSKSTVLYLSYFISTEDLGAKLKQKTYLLLITKALCNETQQLCRHTRFKVNVLVVKDYEIALRSSECKEKIGFIHKSIFFYSESPKKIV